MTPYEAFSLAVRNSERAFAYWTHVSAHAPDPELRAEAEQAARIEMDHVKELRAGRRCAFHDGRLKSDPSSGALHVAGPARSGRELADREAALAVLHRCIANRLVGTRYPWAQILGEIATDEERSAGTRESAEETATPREPLPEDAPALLALAVERLEAAVEFYLRTAEETQDESLVALAQLLASESVLRLAHLRDI